jgi:hypothetical protein
MNMCTNICSFYHLRTSNVWKIETSEAFFRKQISNVLAVKNNLIINVIFNNVFKLYAPVCSEDMTNQIYGILMYAKCHNDEFNQVARIAEKENLV